MVNMTNVREVIKEMVLFIRANVTAASAMKFRRSDQLVEVPSFPFLLYSPVSSEVEGQHENIVRQKEKDGDPTIIEKEISEKNKLTINIHAIDKRTPDTPFDIIDKAKIWFRTQAGTDFCSVRKFVPRIVTQLVTNASNFRETLFLPRVSFTLRLDFSSKFIEEISSIDTIGLVIDTGLPGDPQSKSINISDLTS